VQINIVSVSKHCSYSRLLYICIFISPEAGSKKTSKRKNTIKK